MLPSSADIKSMLQWEEDDQEKAGRRKRIAKLLLKKKHRLKIGYILLPSRIWLLPEQLVKSLEDIAIKTKL